MWKDVVGFEGLYKVSDKGEVYGVKRDKVLKPKINKNGYKELGLYIKGKAHFKYIHRLVAEAFLENKDNLREVNHIDSNKKNNSLENLEWCSSSQNSVHYHQTTGKRGIYFNKASKKWMARIKIDNITTYIGLFKTEEEAYKAYYDTYLEFYGVEPFSLL